MKRCETDALLTRLVSEEIVSVVRDQGIRLRKWNGIASVSEALMIQTVDEKFLKPFSQDQIGIDNILEYAYRAYKGGEFVNFTKGRVDNVVEADSCECISR